MIKKINNKKMKIKSKKHLIIGQAYEAQHVVTVNFFCVSEGEVRHERWTIFK